MRVFAPDYYREFKCIADKCRHSCCVGWEIDIDADTYEFYRSLGGELGERIMKSICVADGTACFVLTENEKCPFLCENGLCELISTLGEGALCSICADHPRFRTFLSDRTELGLGLCCEEAGRLILGREEPFELSLISDDGENCGLLPQEERVLVLREEIFGILKDRSVPLTARLNKMTALCGTEVPNFDNGRLYELFYSLERLDKGWERSLAMLLEQGEGDVCVPEELDTAFEQLAVYFVYRHFADAALDGQAAEAVCFAALSVELIRRLCAAVFRKTHVLTLEDIRELARAYSSEAEYSEENMQALFKACAK